MQVSASARSPKIRRISDPVHGYIEFTDLENQILDQRSAQRLRNVAQSGLAQYVFPEVRTSRFSHCLGTMHASSKLFSGCIRNATVDIRTKLGEALIKLCKSCLNSGLITLHDLGEVLSADSDGILLGHVYFDEKSHQDAAKIVEQALRLAALFHDLGHLPFSHDFEAALQTMGSASFNGGESPIPKIVRSISQPPESVNKSDIHERVGYGVSVAIFKTAVTHRDRDRALYIDIVKQIALKILVAQDTEIPEPLRDDTENAVRWLHYLISSDLDADKCDYLLRDGRNYGFEFAPYNFDRLSNNVVVAMNSDGRFVLAVKPQGQGSVESLVLSRARSYQAGVRHHKVAQVCAALRFSIRSMLLEAREGDILFQFLSDIRDLSDFEGVDSKQKEELESLLGRYANYDDAWAMQQLRARLDKNQQDEWLALVCWRSPGPRSLWKRADQFEAVLSQLFEEKPWATGNPLAWWNVGNLHPDLDLRDKIEGLERDGVLIIRHKFKPWTNVDGESIQLQLLVDSDTDPQLVPISRRSSLVRSLQTLWQEDVQLHAFVASHAQDSTGACEGSLKVGKVSAEACVSRLTLETVRE